VSARRVPPSTVEWANHANQILLAYGAVAGGDVFAMRSRARREAQKVMALFVDLGLYERWELVEHTEQLEDGWRWAVELASELQMPDATYVRQRWVPQYLIDWANHGNEILVEHGKVTGTRSYERRHQARYRAQKLIRLMVELRLREKWELREHTEKTGGGWTWTVEYVQSDDQET
jgi:hypothetical protein